MSRMTLVTTLDFDDDSGLDDALMDKCDRATELGYRLSSVFPHLDRLVLVFQLNKEELADVKKGGEHSARPRV